MNESTLSFAPALRKTAILGGQVFQLLTQIEGGIRGTWEMENQIIGMIHTTEVANQSQPAPPLPLIS